MSAIAAGFLSAMLNLVVLAGVPFLIYWLYQRLRRKRGFGEITSRVGLRRPSLRFVGYSIVLASAIVIGLLIWPPAIEPMTRAGSAQRQFVGLGLNTTSVGLALVYGVLQTGLAEEFFFRGLIAGSLSRRLSLAWANLIQALIFLLPHLLLLNFMPESLPFMPLLFIGALLLGWLRIKSGSIVGPWIVHAAANVATCLSIAARTAC